MGKRQHERQLLRKKRPAATLDFTQVKTSSRTSLDP
jgi:hypothetical protein